MRTVEGNAQSYVRVTPANWRSGFRFAWQEQDPEPEGPGLVWRGTGHDYWSVPGAASRGAPSCSSRRRAAGSRTCVSRTRPASHPSPRSAASTPSRRRRWRPTRCRRRGDPRRSICAQLDGVRLITTSAMSSVVMVLPTRCRMMSAATRSGAPKDVTSRSRSRPTSMDSSRRSIRPSV
jgi:hypothetical protein